jgi:hypothetical protein
MQNSELFPTDPRRSMSAPVATTPDAVLLRYAAGRKRGITLHGVMRDLNFSRSRTLLFMSYLVEKGMLQRTNRLRNGCIIHEVTELARAVVEVG